MTDWQLRTENECPYGFTCHEMTTQSHLDDGECEFWSKCTEAVNISTGSSLDKISNYVDKLSQECDALEKKKQEYSQNGAVSIGNIDRHLKYKNTLLDHLSAVSWLLQNGKHQKYQKHDIHEAISQLEKLLEDLKSLLNYNFNRGYIADKRIILNSYRKKYPATKKSPEGNSSEEIEKQQKSYYYHRLRSTSSKLNFFNERGKSSTEIQLKSREQYVQAKLGIERKNILSKILTKVRNAEEVLRSAIFDGSVDLCHEDYVEEYNKISENSSLENRG